MSTIWRSDSHCLLGWWLSAKLVCCSSILASDIAAAVGNKEQETNAKLQRDDMQVLQGSWSCVRARAFGVSLSADEIAKDDLITSCLFLGDRWLVRSRDRTVDQTSRFKLLPDAQPKRMKVFKDDESILLFDAIYELSNDSLRICFHMNDSSRLRPPLQFEEPRGMPPEFQTMQLDFKRNLAPPRPEEEARKSTQSNPDHPTPPRDASAPKDGGQPAPSAVPPPSAALEALGPKKPPLGAEGASPELPDLKAEELTGLTIDQLEALSKSYKNVFDAVYRDRRSGKGPRPDVGSKEKEVARDLVFKLLPTKSRPGGPDAIQPVANPVDTLDELVRLHRIMTTITGVLVTKILGDAK